MISIIKVKMANQTHLVLCGKVPRRKSLLTKHHPPPCVLFFFCCFFPHSLLSPNHQYNFLSRLFPLLYYQLLHLWLSNSLESCRLNPGKRAKKPMLWGFLFFFLLLFLKNIFSSLTCFKNAAFNFRERCSLMNRQVTPLTSHSVACRLLTSHFWIVLDKSNLGY